MPKFATILAAAAFAVAGSVTQGSAGPLDIARDAAELGLQTAKRAVDLGLDTAEDAADIAKDAVTPDCPPGERYKDAQGRWRTCPRN
jgi:hypothetical protein